MQNWDIERPDAEWYALGDRNLDGLVREVMDRPALSLDTETTGLNIAKDIPLFWSIAWDDRRIAMPAATLPFFKKAFADANKTWVLHNAKYDAHILANVGIDLRGTMIDTKVMHSLLYEDKSHRLKDVALGVMGWKWQDFKDTFGTPNQRKGETIQSILLRCFEQDLPKLVDYAANDAYGTWHIYSTLLRELDSTPTHSLYPKWIATMGDLFRKVEVPFTKVLWKCERRGVVIDTGYLSGIEEHVKKGIAQSERRLAALIGRVINLNSPQQLSQLFYKEYGVKPPKVTKSGGASTDEESLEWIAAGDDERAAQVALQILEHRGLTKLYKTYVIGLGECVDKYGRIHTTLNQDVARCMPAGELVLTSRGYLPVEDVQVGDCVVAHTGKPRRVLEVSTHLPTPIYRVQLANGLVLRTNAEHKYRSGDTWTAAAQLRVGEPVTVHSDVEEWRAITGWSPYEVSSWGRVRNARTGRIRAQQPKGTWGHLKVSLARKGAQHRGADLRDFSVHRLVLQAFGPKGLGEVRHLNGIAWDNTARNLVYGTPHDNRQDARRHGTMSQRRAGRTLLTEEDVLDIKSAARAGQPPSSTSKLSWEVAEEIRAQHTGVFGQKAKLARKYGVTIQAISHILQRKVRRSPPTDGGKTAEELAAQYGVSAGTIRAIWAGRRWQDEDYIEGVSASFYSSHVVSVTTEPAETTYGLTVEEDHSHVTGGIVTHNTGRLSSSDPNLQNIPKPDTDIFKIRAAFTCEADQNLVVADYNALEMRLLAAAALEPDMISIFKQGKDIHMGNAELVFGIPYDDIKLAKKIDGEIKAGLRPESDLQLCMSGGKTVHECIEARSDIKTVCFG